MEYFELISCNITTLILAFLHVHCIMFFFLFWLPSSKLIKDITDPLSLFNDASVCFPSSISSKYDS